MVKNSVKRMTHILSASIALTLTAVLVGCGGAATNTDIKTVDTTSPVEDWVMVWSDEFDGSTIDTNKWSHEVNCDGGGNFEQQCYTDSPDNSFLADGNLNIVAKPSVDGEPLPYTSARMVTKNKGDWTYGRFEMRAKLPSGQGSWPAFWMLSTDEVYGGWPKSGEIDIVESVNLKVPDADGVEENNIFGTLHYGRDFPNNEQSGKAYALADNVNPADDFHTYAIEWQEGEIRWYMDGYLYATQLQSEVRFNSKDEAVGLVHKGWFAEYYDIITGELETKWDSAPFDQDFHILLNFAVGGSFPANTNNGADFPNGIDPAAFAEGQAYQIDYVRVYECASNPMTGKGCETIRNGYKVEASDDEPTGALVLGKAPAPTPPVPEVAVPITIFADGENPAWPLWDCCAGSTPTVEIDDAEHGAVAEFSVLNIPETVQGFYSRDAGTPFNASAMLSTGTVSFEMKIVTAPADGTPWIFKVEADGNTSDSGELNLNTSNEGVDPVPGVWQTYTFDLLTLADNGLDISAIDVVMVFPAWGAGAGAVYRIDNLRIAEPGNVVFPELVLFEDTANTAWPLWDCCAGSSPTEETDDEEHGTVAEFSVNNIAETVQGFFGRDNGSFDASALLTEGVFQFEMKIVTAPADGTPWIMKMEADGNTSDSGEINLNNSLEGLDPVPGEWQTYTFDLLTLADAGLDLSTIDVVMVFPAWGAGLGAVYRIDNAKIFNPNANTGPTGPRLVAFADAQNPEWPLWDCCAGSTPTVEIDDADHGAVAEFSVNNIAETVQGFYSRDAGSPFDAEALLSTGTVSFEMKIVTAPADGTPWIFKIEADGNTSDSGELNLNTSKEGLDPVPGEWQTYTFDLLTLADNGLDLSAIDVIMVFPAWGAGLGAVYRVDNLIIGNPGDAGGVDGAALTLYADAMNAEWPLWDCCAGSTPAEVTDDAQHGSVAEFSVLNIAETVQGFYSRDVGTPFDAEGIISGTFSFEMKIVTAPADGTPWIMKMEANGNTSDSGELNLNTSNEGQDPVAGEWQTYTFDILTLLDAGLDISQIDVVMVFPAWGAGLGAVYRIDNAVFKP
jgi:beta-glucanase (GH16 family)